MAIRRPLLIGALGLCAVLAAPTAIFTAPSPAAADNTARQNSSEQQDKAGQADSLRSLAAGIGLRIGTAVNTDLLASNPAYRDITAAQFSTVTPENVMKWGAVEPTRGNYDWSGADRLVEFAAANRQLVRGHTLVWHSQLPAWLNASAPGMSPDELRAVLHKHITDEVTHFKGKIWQWDVVNEAFNEDGTLRNSIWLQKLGPGYIADAFRWAHEADPQAKLFYNDYNIESTGAKSNAVYALMKDLKAQGVPVDGVGFQTHLDTKYPLPDLKSNLQRFAALGLDVAETEVDVRTTLPVTPVEHSAQVAAYSQTLQACMAVKKCISYTVWGFSDAYSWVPGVFKGEGAANIYDENLTPKPEYFALQQDLALGNGAPHRAGRGAGNG